MKYFEFVSQPSFFFNLFKIDQDLAKASQQSGCQNCGDKLDVANFWRSGHGMPESIDDECRKRFSFCCRGCRKRMTPDSLRFLRGMSYVTITLTLFCAIYHGLTGERAKVLTQALGVSRQTVARWIKWWRDSFVATSFWQAEKARFMPLLDETKLAFELLTKFESSIFPPDDSLKKLLMFLAPWRKKEAL